MRRPEGPFGDHYGYYSLRHDYPVFEVDAIAHRRDAIYPATVVGKPRQEDFYIGDLLQELLSPLFPLVMPAVRDALVVRRDRLPLAGGGGGEASATAREAMASAFRILGEGQLSLTKFLLLTDRPVDLRDFRATLEHVLARTHPETDLYVFANLSMDTLDYTGPRVNEGSKGVWLGLGDPVRELPREFRGRGPPPGRHRRARLLRRLPRRRRAALSPPSRRPAARLAAHPAFAGWPLVVLTDEPRARRARAPINFLWTTFTRFEPAADIHAAASDARAQPRRPAPADPHRRAAQARLPDGAVLRRRDGGRRHPALEGVLPRPVEMGDSGVGHLDPG